MRKFFLYGLAVWFVALPAVIFLVGLLTPAFGIYLAYNFYIYPLGIAKTYIIGPEQIELPVATVVLALSVPNLVYSAILSMLTWFFKDFRNSLRNADKR